jgi:hypothetical protein
MQAGNNDNETFKPHAYVDELTDEKQPEHTSSEISKPQQLGNNYIAKDECPVIRAVRAIHTVLHHETLVMTCAIPSYELFHEIAIGYNHARG